MSRDVSIADDQIIAGVLAGQHEGFGILVQRYLPVVQAVAGAQLYNLTDVDDAAQETFLRAFQRLDQLRDRKKFGPWLTTITRNVAMTFLRQRGRDRDLTQKAAIEEPAKTPDFARRELREIVRDQIESLDADAREVLLLKYFAGKGSREIAGILDVSHPAVRKRLERARKALSHQLLDALQDDEGLNRVRETQSHRIVKTVLGAGAAWSAASAGTAATVSAGTGIAVAAGTGLAAAAGATFSKVLVAAVVLLAIGGAVLTTQLNSTNTPQPSPEPVVIAPEPEEPVATAEASADPDPSLEPVESVVAAVAETPEGIPVTGRILHTDGSPIPNAKVFGAYWGHKPRMGKLETTADEEGRYTLTLIKPWDRFLVYAEKDGYARFRQTSVDIPKTGAKNVDYTLFRQASIEGQVVNAQGAAMADMPVTSFNRDAENIMWTSATKSDEQGQFKITGLIPGRHSLAVVEERAYDSDMEDLRVEIKEGDHLTDLRVPYNGEGMVISGRVTDADGQPIKGAFLQARNGNNPRDDYSDEAGNYRIIQLPEGAFSVNASNEKYQYTSRLIESGSEDADFVLQRRGSVEGRVIDGNTGQPMQSFSVYAVGGATSSLNLSNERWFKQVNDEQGRFVIHEVHLDKATVIAKAEGYMPAFHLVELAPEQHLEGITLVLSRGFSVQGTVMDKNGNPISKASIVLGPQPYKPEGSDGKFFAQQLAEIARATSDENGVFTLTGLSPGSQKISGYHPDFGAGSVTATLSPNTGNILPQIVLSRGGVIRGTITLGGAPQSGVAMMVTPPGGMGMPIAQGQSDDNGQYELNDVRAGEFSVMATLSAKPGPSDMIGRRTMRTITVADGQTIVADLNFTTDTGDLVGKVVVDGVPEFYGNVIIRTMDAENEETRMAQLLDGEFQSPQLPTGSILVTVNMIPGTPGSPGFGNRTLMKTVETTIQSGETSTVEIIFSGRSTVSGTVLGVTPTEHSSVMILEGEVDVPQFDLTALSLLTPLARGNGVVGTDGIYTIEGLDAGTYTLLAFAAASNGPDFADQLRFATLIITVPENDNAIADFDLR